MASTTTPDPAPPWMPRADRRDWELLAAAAEGDEQAFATIFRRHVDALRGFIAARVGSVEAEDLVAETFVVAWRSCSRFDGRFTSARPWLYGIAAKVLQRHREIEQRWQRSIAAGTAHEATTIPDDGFQHAADPVLVRAIARLDAREREVLLLHALGELRIVEAAAALGITPIAARVRLHRARKHLVAAMEGTRDG